MIFKKTVEIILIAIIRIYQYVLSPVLPHVCRFYPSCSQYAYEAVKRYGALKGLILAVKRFFKCHPFHPGGIDLLP